jgi:hypothetical protein
MLFSMSFANLIGVYFLLPVIREELVRFKDFVRRVDKGDRFEHALAVVKSESEEEASHPPRD